MALLLAAAALVPAPLVLPLLSSLLITAALVVAAVAWWRGARRDGARPTAWDLAGLLTFLGCCAALLSDPEEVLPMLQAKASR